MSAPRRAVRAHAWWLALFLWAAPAGAATLNVGYIDSARIFLEYADAKDAQARFDRQVQSWRDEAAEKEKAVNQLRAEVRDQAPILSALKRQEREEALQKAISEYERFVQQIWGPNGSAAQENERMTREVVDRIRAAVKNCGYNFPAKRITINLAPADIKTLDLTGEVIAALNASAVTPTGGH